MRDSRESCAGFTLVELMITASVMIPLLFAALTTTGILQSHVVVERRVSDVDTKLSQIGNSLFALGRPALLSSIETRSSVSDSWASPIGATEYPAIRFATDDPSEPPIELEFVREAGETANGVDDDGDGLIDEGRLDFRRIGEANGMTLLSRVEAWSVRLEGRLLVFTIQYAQVGEEDWIFRARREVRVCLRNN